MIAGLLDLSQLRGEATAFRLSLSPLALEVRLTFGEFTGRRRQRDVVPLLLIPQGGVGVGEFGREGRFALDQPGSIGSGRFVLASRFSERSTGVGNFFFGRSARGTFLSDPLLQLLPGRTHGCLQLAGLDDRCRYCRRMTLLRGGARAQSLGERVFDSAAFVDFLRDLPLELALSFSNQFGNGLAFIGCARLARMERCFSVCEPALENALRSGRRVKLHRQFGFAPRKPFGVRDCRGMTQTDPFDFDCGFAELFVNHVPRRTFELALPCLIDRTCDHGRQVSEQ